MLAYASRVGQTIVVEKRTGEVLVDSDTSVPKGDGTQKYVQIRQLLVDFADGDDEGDIVFACAWCDEYATAYGSIRRHIGERHRKAAEKAVGYLMAGQEVPARVKKLVPVGLFCEGMSQRDEDALRTQIADLMTRNAELVQLAKGDKEPVIEKLRADNAKLAKEVSELTEENESAKSDLDDAMAELQDVRTQAAKAQGEAEAAKKSLSDFKGAFRNLMGNE